MTNESENGFGAHALTWALIVGAALLFLEITWSPVPAANHTAEVQTVPVAAATQNNAG